MAALTSRHEATVMPDVASGFAAAAVHKGAAWPDLRGQRKI